MENPSPFRLDQAIRQWRRDLELTGALTRDDLDELEAHLRDAVTAITARGVSTPEAFRQATENLGPADAMAREFAAANPHRPWLGRAVWIFAGLTLVKVPIYLGGLGYIALLYSVADWTGRSDAAVLAASLGSLLIKALLVFGFWRLGRVSWEKMRAFAMLCVRRPLVPILLSSLLVVSLNPLLIWVHTLFATTGGMQEAGLPLARTISGSFYFAESLMWLALPFWLMRQQALRPPGTNPSWLDRCLWISVGVAGYWISTPLLGPAARIAHGLSGLVTSNPDWRTVVWSAGKWMTVGALVTVAAWIIQTQPGFSLKVKRWIGRHPFFGFVATAVILFGLCWAASVAAAASTSVPRLSGSVEAYLHEIPNLAFIGALFWLGRKWVIPKPRTAAL